MKREIRCTPLSHEPGAYTGSVRWPALWIFEPCDGCGRGYTVFYRPALLGGSQEKTCANCGLELSLGLLPVAKRKTRDLLRASEEYERLHKRLAELEKFLTSGAER